VKGELLTLEEQQDEENLWHLLIGISACVDTLWWMLWGWFIYIKTNATDSTMCVNSDCLVELVPIGWFWGALSPFGATTGYTAL